MRPRVLVAGIGNLFLGDDGFGVEVARRLRGADLPQEVRIADYGISGIHLAFDLLGGYDTTILIDAAPRGETPGTVSVLEVTTAHRRGQQNAAALLDAHGMQPEAVLELLDMLGGDAGQVLVVCCEPFDTAERIGLSDPVSQAVDTAMNQVVELARGSLTRLDSRALAKEV